MNNEEYKAINYTFYIQSPEDFYHQLKQFADENYAEEAVEDTQLAEEMLQAIGIATK
jgi:lysozyme family protein